MKRESIAVGLTVVVLGLMVGITPATTAQVTGITVSGPDQAEVNQNVTFNASFNGTDDVSVENYTLQFTSVETNESVNVTVASNCTILEFEPSTGVVGNHAIYVDELNESLNVTCPDATAVQAGYEADAAATQDAPALIIEFNTSAFEPTGTYSLEVFANTTTGERLTSNTAEFEVTEANTGE